MIKRSKNQTKGPHTVGYGRPPKSRQWVKGQSGNPNGSPPKESLDALGYLTQALKHKVAKPIDTQKMTVLEAIMFKLATDAAKGKSTAMRELLKIMSFAEAVDQRKVVITARLLFEEEENKYMKTAQENRRLLDEVAKLRGLLDERGCSKIS